MKKVTVTEDMIKYWRYEHREADWSPKKPYCKLCSHLDTRHRWRSRFSYFELGEIVYKVQFMNGHEGYYHIDCIDNPETMGMKMKVENILRYDVDRWDTVKVFIENLRSRHLGNAQMVREVMDRFNCSRATAYRKLRWS